MLITHAPPRGVGDGTDPVHRGFPALNVLAERLPPAVLLQGQVDPQPAGPPDGRLGGTLVRNATGWQLFDLDPGTGQVNDVTRHHSAAHNHGAGYNHAS
jgi:hypothetical protein